MCTLAVLILASIIAVSSGFAYDDEHNTDLARERFARELDQKQKFAFAFAKRGEDVPDAKQRFARDLENAKKFAFAFAKRSSDDELRARYPRTPMEDQGFAREFAKRSDDRLMRFARPSFA
ncbi:hypothetical protein RB195_002907 [Necator americanus]|uniref:Nematode fatty acid retinoid binding protein n=1 Tax=Necator americanus TaxID=51031 RepID=A0ABR1DL84_NECAM